MARGEDQDDKISKEQEAREKRIAEWNNDWSIHNRMIQRIAEPVERWNYICDNVKIVAMCEAIVEHCAKIGLKLQRPRLDWAALKAIVYKIGEAGKADNKINWDRAKRQAHRNLDSITCSE